MKHLIFENTDEITKQLEEDHKTSKRLWTAFAIILGIAFLINCFGFIYILHTKP